MPEQIDSNLAVRPAGRWIVMVAAVVGVAVFVYQLTARDELLYFALLEGAGLTAVLLIVLGLAQRFWEGEKVQAGQLPGGAGLQFEPAEAAQETRGAVEKLNERVTTQSEQLIDLQRQLDRRVTDLEGHLFKDPRRPPEES